MSDHSLPTNTPPASSYYERHVFFCLNDRVNGEESCAHHGAQEMFDHCKKRVKAEGLAGPGKVRINKAGCMDRCDDGPVIVVYPEEVWYHYVDKEDVEEIIQEHLLNGRVVERLKI